MLVASVIRRHMKRTPHFQTGESDGKLHPEPGEAVVGTYRSPFLTDPVLVFSDAALYMVSRGGRSERVAWADIVSYASPPTKSAETLAIETVNGRQEIPIRGRHGEGDRFSDLYSLLMVVRAVIAHNQRTPPANARRR
jgi:hypothetical protein